MTGREPRGIRVIALALLAAALFLAAAHRAEASRTCELLPLVVGRATEQLPARSGELTVVTLNMAEETDVAKIMRDLSGAPGVRDADLFLLQEVMNAQVVEGLARELKFHHVYAPADVKSPVAPRGLAMLSRYPFDDLQHIQLKVYNLHFRSRCRLAVGMTVHTPSGALRAWDIHLDNRISAKERVEQLRPVVELAAAKALPALIGGDLNTSKMRWVEHTLPLPYFQMHASVVRRFMESHGFVTPLDDGTPTFDVLPFRLDWIYLKNIIPLANGIERMGFSDHHAVWMTIRLNKTQAVRN